MIRLDSLGITAVGLCSNTITREQVDLIKGLAIVACGMGDVVPAHAAPDGHPSGAAAAGWFDSCPESRDASRQRAGDEGTAPDHVSEHRMILGQRMEFASGQEVATAVAYMGHEQLPVYGESHRQRGSHADHSGVLGSFLENPCVGLQEGTLELLHDVLFFRYLKWKNLLSVFSRNPSMVTTERALATSPA